MRTLTLTILMLALSACTIVTDLPPRQIVGSGKLITKDFVFSDFTGIGIGNAFQAEIAQADTFSVSITLDDNLFDYLRVEKQGTTLQIYFVPGYNVRQMGGAKAKITLPTLEYLNLSGATTGTITGFKSNLNLNANISGASTLRGDLEASNARLEASGASRITLTGSAKEATLIATGASTLNLGDFAVDSANVELSGASNGTIRATSKLDYNLSGASHLTYTGNPTVGRSATSGASTATRK